MAYPITYRFASADQDYICALQQRTGAGALVLNGSGVDATSTYLLNNPRVILRSSGFERTVSLTSGGNVSGVNFTIAGKDIRGTSISETLAGPSGNTVYTTAYFYEVDSVTASGTVGSDVSVGIGTTGKSQWYTMDYDLTPINIGFGVSVSGTDLTWSIETTTYNVQNGEPPEYAILDATDANLVSETQSRQILYPFFGAARCVISASTDGSLVWDIYQAGIV